MEAMASGLAVVATRVGGVPEVIEHEHSGLLVEAGSARALADAITQLHANPALRKRLGAQARDIIEQRFEIATAVERRARLYRELLLGGAR